MIYLVNANIYLITQCSLNSRLLPIDIVYEIRISVTFPGLMTSRMSQDQWLTIKETHQMRPLCYDNDQTDQKTFIYY